MIPVKLNVRGFLSYKKPVELSFNDFDIACIAGDNGAGKSSLLDAITWVLFGKARRSDEGVINNRSKEAEVSFQFLYENALYRVQRLKARTIYEQDPKNPQHIKTKSQPTVLEFQIMNGEEWKVLTGKSVAETQSLINQTLHMDYDTFINASFFLQGKADEFTQKNSTQRKEILAGILGMDLWEHYQDAAREARRSLESSQKIMDASLKEVEDELAQEEERKKTLTQAKEKLSDLESRRKEKQQQDDQARKVLDLLQEQRKTMNELNGKLNSQKELDQQISKQIAERELEEQTLLKVLDASEQIEQDFQKRTAVKEKLQELDAMAARFYNLQQKQAAVEKSVAVEESRLKQKMLSLENEKKKVQQMESTAADLKKKKDQLSDEFQKLQKEAEDQVKLKADFDGKTAQRSALLAENNTLRNHMQKLKERMNRLQEEKGSICPLCGQSLSEEHRQKVIREIEEEGKQDADIFHKNEAVLAETQKEIAALEKQLADMDRRMQRLRVVERDLGVLEKELIRIAKEIAIWKKEGALDLKKVKDGLEKKLYADAFRDQEAALLKEIEKLGYDAALHESYRKQEQVGREIEKKHQDSLIAASRLEPLRREMETLRYQKKTAHQEIQLMGDKLADMEPRFQQAEEHLPDLEKIENRLHELIEEENQQRTVVGGAMQLLAVIKNQKERKKKLHSEMKDISKKLVNLSLIEKAFGRNGVQALLMEEALPQMQMQANEILGRLSSGKMSVRFETEREYKDKKRDDKMQVLDILINDAEGVQRPYDLYSGGEMFRINFAVRLALSKVLAQRAGARLQMLVIDEGFGSQDAEGRQKLIEAINMIRPDFKKILVITHLEELKDAFPARVEVRKTHEGSQVEVILQ